MPDSNPVFNPNSPALQLDQATQLEQAPQSDQAPQSEQVPQLGPGIPIAVDHGNPVFDPNAPPAPLPNPAIRHLSDRIDVNGSFPILPSTAIVVGKGDTINGVYGGSRTQTGVVGESETFTGVSGDGPIMGVSGTSAGDGVVGEGKRGVVGISHDPNSGGVFGTNDKGGTGVFGQGDGAGVYGKSDGGGIGVFGQSGSGDGVRATSTDGNGLSARSTNSVAIFAESVNKASIVAIGHPLAGQFVGDVTVTGDITLGGGDCAEDFDIAEVAEPGTVMVLGDEGSLYQSHRPYDKRVAGVVSGAGAFKPGIVLDKQPSPRNRQPIGLLGKVYCKVDAQFGAIEIGDLLTTSASPGHAMKADDPLKAFGAVIGKALRPLEEGQGLIPILIALQ